MMNQQITPPDDGKNILAVFGVPFGEQPGGHNRRPGRVLEFRQIEISDLETAGQIEQTINLGHVSRL